MRNKITNLLLLLALLLPCAAFAQGKVYTRKIKLEDFPVSTTKVVLEGESFLAITVREEVMCRWRVSPFEFCTLEEYESLKTDCRFYFLRITREDGLAFLTLEKGGREDDPEQMRRPFSVLSLPVAADGRTSGHEFAFMGAFIDVLQHFTEDAMDSDAIGYTGLAAYSGTKLDGKDVFLTPSAADGVMIHSRPNAVAGVVVTPQSPGRGLDCYKLLIGADDHVLYHFSRERYSRESDGTFTDKDVKSFSKLHGNVVE